VRAPVPAASCFPGYGRSQRVSITVSYQCLKAAEPRHSSSFKPTLHRQQSVLTLRRFTDTMTKICVRASMYGHEPQVMVTCLHESSKAVCAEVVSPAGLGICCQNAADCHFNQICRSGSVCGCRAQAYVGAFLRRPNGSREAANAASLEGDLHLDENGQIIRPAARTEDGAADPADMMHDVGTFAQVRTIHRCVLLIHSRGRQVIAHQCSSPPLVLSSPTISQVLAVTGAHDSSDGRRCAAAAAGPPAPEEDGHGTLHITRIAS